MKNGHCSKFFPKKFVAATSFDSDGYPIYRRRDTKVTTIRKRVPLDNRFVVPYNPKLLMKYRAHINIEYCNKSNSIKYLFKYINKGVDRVTMSMSVQQPNKDKYEDVDEIKQYYDCRYLSPCEALWRLYSFEVHLKWSAVKNLIYHLPKKQVILFKEQQHIKNVLQRNRKKNSMFTAWMEANAQYPNAKGSGELYYLRLLLSYQRGCSSYEDLKSHKNQTYETFRDTCDAMGLLKDDREFIDGIHDVATRSSGAYVRNLFVTYLLGNTLSNPLNVWNQTWHELADGILYNLRKAHNQPDLVIEEHRLKDLCLMEIDKILMVNGKSLKDFAGMPRVEANTLTEYGNVLLLNELNFDTVEMSRLHAENFCKLNNGQSKIYHEIIDVVNADNGGFFFVYGYGGIGKTFLWKTLTYKLRSEKKIILNVASSGIASLLLPGGRTAHSLFSIPLSLNEDSCCGIPQGSPKAQLLQLTKLIIWDEAPMVSRYAFEALDRTLRDIMRFTIHDSCEKPFGGKVIVLGGDFRKILPVIPKGRRAEIVMSTINSSRLWRFCKVLNLTENMRLTTSTSTGSDEEIKRFAKWVLDVGDGNLGHYNDGESDVQIPNDLLIYKSSNPIADIVNLMYPDIVQNVGCVKYYSDKAILAPMLDAVDSINQYALSLFPGNEKTYLSSDSVWRVNEDIGIEADWLTTEFLNGIRCSGIPDHKLVLKEGAPVMLMRNLARLLDGGKHN
ncbi:uncharacterized protein LOC130719634 [Lotus japonicus]|uniref:uncharacterized protein LOC130719634 n=1 Tax=Lotus japonicus TaxID=34305 RepID=UPI0025890852|nr:uncharacterized protein LOC130719634 [Lotus japonicus]